MFPRGAELSPGCSMHHRHPFRPGYVTTPPFWWHCLLTDRHTTKSALTSRVRRPYTMTKGPASIESWDDRKDGRTADAPLEPYLRAENSEPMQKQAAQRPTKRKDEFRIVRQHIKTSDSSVSRTHSSTWGPNVCLARTRTWWVPRSNTKVFIELQDRCA